ncbi:monovalent cation:proton antiporter-2 (CPA2) family protein [Amantichitinum ursilacus]|uniref:Glutathione-regulated potassium-efflux system protein KefC n=1 Tax=Amantichitinum ursilacus TaxID=857265 RepID=A0A0N0XL51_9NEIS|nr:monovalent cation:proton antiporter-2 (CPA2) family protein [Amantichitinum ursilacus]KPC55234.1 Glutathione-regulated potassium-efflux system protein KefC [Amantichitinum ursilacus]
MPGLTQAILLLAAAVLVVPILKRFGLAAVLGYLVAGVLIGPWGLKLVGEPEQILQTTEFGVVLLMFVIGLELQPSRLWVLRRAVFGLGGAQVVLCSLALGSIAMACGLSWEAAAVVGVSLSMSSTAFVLQMLAEKNQLTTQYGRDAFAVLLFQDLSVIPVLAALPWLSPGHVDQSGIPLWMSLLALVAIIAAGRFLLRPAFGLVARAKSRDLLTMATLLVVTGTAWLMEAAGLSMSLGAFVAGVLLADSEFRHEVEANIEPFKGVLLGMFFVAVGLSANMGLLVAKPLLVVLLAVGLMVVKALILWGIERVAGATGKVSRRFAVYLCQGGEFAFVLLSLADEGRILPQATAQLLSLAVTLSMALTPFVVLGHERIIVPWREKRATREFDELPELDNPVIVAGFGRFGQVVARMLRSKRIKATLLEISPDQVDFVKRFGNQVYYGDASRVDLLRAAGADKAKVFVLAIDDIPASIKTAETVREHFPHLKIFARARNRFHYYRLMDLGVESAVRETFPASVELGIDVLEALGTTRLDAERTGRIFRQHDEALLQRQMAIYHDEDKLIQASRDAMQELEALFEADEIPSEPAPYHPAEAR